MITKAIATAVLTLLSSAGLAGAEEILRYDKHAGYEIKPTNIRIVLLSNGQVVKSTHFLMENTTSEEAIATLAPGRLENILTKVSAVNSLAPFVDQQEGQPICMDAPSFIYSMNLNGKNIMLAKKANCHDYYLQDGVAAELVGILQILVKLAE